MPPNIFLPLPGSSVRRSVPLSVLARIAGNNDKLPRRHQIRNFGSYIDRTFYRGFLFGNWVLPDIAQPMRDVWCVKIGHLEEVLQFCFRLLSNDQTASALSEGYIWAHCSHVEAELSLCSVPIDGALLPKLLDIGIFSYLQNQEAGTKDHSPDTHKSTQQSLDCEVTPNSAKPKMLWDNRPEPHRSPLRQSVEHKVR